MLQMGSQRWRFQACTKCPSLLSLKRHGGREADGATLKQIMCQKSVLSQTCCRAFLLVMDHWQVSCSSGAMHFKSAEPSADSGNLKGNTCRAWCSNCINTEPESTVCTWILVLVSVRVSHLDKDLFIYCAIYWLLTVLQFAISLCCDVCQCSKQSSVNVDM